MIQANFDFYLTVCEKCLENATQFQKDALLLREHQSFGHAYASAVLGFEELAKAGMYFEFFFGLEGEYEYNIKEHITKQTFLWNYIALFIFSKFFGELKKQKEITIADFSSIEKFDFTEKQLIQIAKQHLNSTNEEFAHLCRLFLELIDVLATLEKDPYYMNERKKRGLYVDPEMLNEKNYRLPQQFSESDMVLVDMFKVIIEICSEVFSSFKAKLSDKNFQTIITNIRKGILFFKQKIEELEEVPEPAPPLNSIDDLEQ